MKNNSGKVLLFYSIGAVLISSIVRFFQYVSIVEFDTGFFVKGSEAAGILIYILLIAFGLIFIALSFLQNKKQSSAFTLSSAGMGDHATQPLGISYLLAAVLVGIKAVNSGINLNFFMQIIAAVSILAIGFLLLKNVEPPKLTGHLNLIVTVYCFVQTVGFFNADLVVLKHSESLIILVSYILMTVFFASSARFYARLETKKSRLREIITAGLTFIITATYTISKIAAILFGGDAVKGMDGINFEIVAGAFLSAAFLSVILMTKKTKEIEILPEIN